MELKQGTKVGRVRKWLWDKWILAPIGAEGLLEIGN
jgi:hypothetical protein